MRPQAIEKLAVKMSERVRKYSSDPYLLDMAVKMEILTSRKEEDNDACASVIKEVMNSG